jgi:hypothetical protein
MNPIEEKKKEATTFYYKQANDLWTYQESKKS